jgi:hypothetical protein
MSEVHYSVSVRDDHDGGSVWYVEEDYMDEEDATELAKKLSCSRDNRAARVNRVESSVVATWDHGSQTGAA